MSKQIFDFDQALVIAKYAQAIQSGGLFAIGTGWIIYAIISGWPS